MGNRKQLTGVSALDWLTSKRLPDGYVTAITSAGNPLHFTGPAERSRYILSNRAQMGRNAGAGDTRGR